MAGSHPVGAATPARGGHRAYPPLSPCSRSGLMSVGAASATSEIPEPCDQRRLNVEPTSHLPAVTQLDRVRLRKSPR